MAQTQPDSRQQQADAAYRQSVTQTRARILAYGAALWAATPSFDQPSLDLFVARIVPAVRAAQLRVANLTAVHYGQVFGRRPVPVDPDVVTGGRGVPATTVYARPVVAARTVYTKAAKENALPPTVETPTPVPGLEVAPAAPAATAGPATVEPSPAAPTPEPVNLDEAARETGSRRMESLITTDLQMAKIRQADLAFGDAGRKNYRRVTTSDRPCALCLIASTQTYHVGELLPIHPGCQCEVAEIPTGSKLSDLFDADALLEATHAKVEEFAGISDRGGRAPDYRKLLITHRHGELGDVLAWRGQRFTGPAQIVQDLPSGRQLVNLNDL